METTLRSREAGAIVLVAAAVALFAVTAGTRSVVGLFLSPIHSATGLGIAAISFALALSQLAWGAAQPVCGLLAERYGTARVIAGGGLLAAAAGVMLPFADSMAMLIVVLAVSGITGTVGSPSLLAGAVSPRVAPERRGLVIGIIGAGGPLGQLVLAPATQAMITLAGWVSAAISVAALSLVTLPLAFAFRRPAGADARPAGEELLVPLRASLTHPHYWLINAAFFICGLHVFFLVAHLPGVIEHCGLAPAVSGAALAILGLFNIAGCIGAGLVIRRHSMKRTLAALFAARGIGIVLFLAAPKTELVVFGFSAWMGLTYMAVLPPVAGLVGKLCGMQRLATLLGITFLVHQAGSFVGGWLGGIVAEATGSYHGMWMLDLSLAGLAAILCLGIREREAGPNPPPAAGPVMPAGATPRYA